MSGQKRCKRTRPNAVGLYNSFALIARLVNERSGRLLVRRALEGVRAPNRQPRKERPPRQPRVQKKRLWRDDGFFRWDDWRKLRYRALVKHGARCQCCGADRRSGITIHVDHIISRHKCPELEFELSNLQVLCEACNIGKGWRDETDWRDGSVIWGDKWTE